MKKILYLVTLILFMGQLSFAQTTITTATGTTGYTGTNGVTGSAAITFVVENTNSSAIILDAIENFKGTTLASPAIFSLWYSTTSISGAPTITSPDWTLINTTNSLTLNAGYNTIFSGLGFQIPAGAMYRFAIQSNNGMSYSGTVAGNCTPSTLSDGGVNLILGDAQVGGSYVGYAGTFPSPTNNPRWFTGSITFFPAVPCTAPPVAGTATSSSALGCAGTPFILDISGASQGTGLSFQWDSSSNGTAWFPITGGTTKKISQTQVSTSYYRCGVTCSGIRANSTPVLVTTPALVSGNFTINSGIATGGNNFQTFSDAINYVSCGINGPVLFNVAPSSGPYDEQVSIPQIGGTSATNTITIKGNGQTLGSANASTTNRGILTLNGADYVNIDSLVIDATQGTFGWGVLLMGKADNNTIKKCVINCNATATTTNFIGIVINGSNSAVAINGDNANNNIITNNEINGGFYSVYLYGNSTNSTLNNNNSITKNNLKDFYSYCINPTHQSSGLVISGNEIWRPYRTNSSATAGVYLAAGCFGALVEKNRIHNMFDGFATSTSLFYGIYDATDGKPGQEVKVINNLIYNINGNGIQYGIFNIGGDSMQAYHNTIVLDDAATTTGSTYGFYQTVLANKIDFRNNLIAITRSGTGAKRCIALITATSDVRVNNNSLYFNPTAGTTNFFGQFGTATFATFANWQTANNNGYDQQSVEGDPLFLSPSTGDFTPANPNINDIGANLGVSNDINGVVRSLNPDPGAIEFTIPPCTNPPTPGSIVAVSNICPNTTFSLNITGNSYGSSQTYTWEKSVNGTTGWIAVGVPSTNPQILTSQTATFFYRCGVKCGTGSTVYTPIQLITSPSLVAGTYTINSNIATGGTNFQTFADAINHISCGISGSVIFNVVANSGPYTENITIPAVKGVSAINTITINGNGVTLNYVAPDLNNKAAIILNGSDHIIIDSLNIDVSTSTVAGWGIVLTNTADSNVIKRCTITNNAISTSTNYIGILINGSATATATSGNNGNFNQIINNTFLGGYYGVYLYGNSASNAQNNNNIVRKNIFQDAYTYGVLNVYQSSGLVVSQNDISRPSRTNSGVCGGVSIGTGTTGSLTEKNRIHNMFDAFGTATTTFYAIYVNGDGKAGKENKVINNLVYNINSNGQAYGIYNVGADSMQAYHNTIVLDDGGTTTGATYGLYQTTLASGIIYKNNLVYITRTGTGIKRCIHLNTITSNVISNNNLFYLNSTGGTNNNVGQFGTTNYATLNDWKTTANGYDQQSISVDPLLSNPNPDDYVPTNGLVNGVGANVGVTSDINGNVRGITPDPGAFEIAVSGCSNPPISGSATSSSANACPNVVFTLNLSGNSSGSGQTYAWEKSANGTSGWIPVGTASPNPSRSTSQLSTTYYRCGVTCNAGTTVYSSTLMVITPTAISGDLYINSSVATSGNTFQTFTEAFDYLVCGGLGGAVNLNVVPGSGPYNEKIYIPQILGLSSTNKLTIYGNGATLNYTTSDAANRAAIILDGADNIVIDSLNIDVSGGTYGWGILLMNQADDNIIRNCTINTNATATTTNFAGILINGSATAVTASGNNGNNNIITNNTINGGNTGIYLYGSTTNSTQNVNNKVINNRINDFYTYAVYAQYQSTGLVISSNNIARETRTNSGNCAGVYIATNCTGISIEKNRIHNMFDGQPTSTSIFYGVYVGADGKSNQINKVINNLVYDINGNGTAYGLYNTNGDSMQAYHNTIVFEDAGGATSAATYGIYQTGTASGVSFRNNIVVITRSGTGIKRCVYFVTTTSSITSNNNVFYINSTGGTNNNIGQYGTTNYLALGNWQTANSNAYDAQSLSFNPAFIGTASGNYIPTSIPCDNIGANLSVATDILGLPRPATPDAGAFEFVGTVPVTLVNFVGEKRNTINKLQWTTLTELNNTGFELQRSANGKDFSTLTFIKSKAENGASNAAINYSFEDVKPLVTTNYYRLKQIDKDGKSTLSNIVVLAGNKVDRFEMTNLYPNPAVSNLNITINATKDENIQLVVTDIVGKILIQEKRFVTKGTNSTSLNTQKLCAGMYIVKAITANATEIISSKFVKN
jgi:hypothetical protein